MQPEPEAVGVHAGLAGQNAHGQLFPAHLEAEDANAGAVLGGVHCDVDGEGALAHAGARGEDDEVGGLESAEQVVQGGEAAHDDGAGVGHRLRKGGAVFQKLVQNFPDGDELAGGVSGTQAK